MFDVKIIAEALNLYLDDFTLCGADWVYLLMNVQLYIFS